jgi:hypothetical protein
MSDEYICRVCGHRAGDHAVNNICLVEGCDCKDDPYLEQLALITTERDALAKKLEASLDLMDLMVRTIETRAVRETMERKIAEIERTGEV